MDLPPQLSFALYMAAFALGFPLNTLAIAGAVSHARLRLTPSLVYALHLGCSDLLLATSLPLKAVEALAGGAWPLPAPLCPAFALVHFAPLYAGGGFLAALSVGRYLGAAFPLGYQAARRPRYSWGVCVAIWALVLCHLGLVFGLEAPGGWMDNTTRPLGINTPVNGSPVCLEAWDPASAGPARLSLSLLLFFLPLTITAFCYVGCLRALAGSGLSHRRKLRAAWVAGGALLTLLLCLGPYNASNVAGFLHPNLGSRWRKLGLITVAMTMDTSPDRSSFPGNHWLYFSVYLFTFLLGLPLNLVALAIFVSKLRRRPVAVDVLLLNLTLSDLLLLLFLPFRMVEAASGMHWPLPFIFCPLSGFLFFTTIYLTSLFLAAVSIERFLSVAHPVWYKTQPRPRQAGLVSGACWLLAAAHCSVVYVTEFSGNSSHSSGINGTCYLEFREDQLALLLPVRLEMAVVLFGVPLLITSYCYSRLVCILGRRASHRRRKRVAGLVAATLLNFLVCFGPYNVSHVIGYIQGKSPAWRGYVLLLSTLNSCVDPLVYYFSSSGFQADFKGLLGRLAGAWGPWRQQGCVKLKKNEGEGPPQELSNIETR
ncbi:Free fatty acid receptor 3 [Camelus dromedarius]|uniref:Free fatty acid receptor 1 n=2 Tax=Camelus dromedarius TaxID=9838 RepID=A0A5N4DT48_CAMDR|nr:Free fatty acid receptor 3 [Camelus dromedarius]